VQLLPSARKGHERVSLALPMFSKRKECRSFGANIFFFFVCVCDNFVFLTDVDTCMYYLRSNISISNNVFVAYYLVCIQIVKDAMNLNNYRNVIKNVYIMERRGYTYMRINPYERTNSHSRTTLTRD
jgi:hypothetical protein